MRLHTAALLVTALLVTCSLMTASNAVSQPQAAPSAPPAIAAMSLLAQARSAHEKGDAQSARDLVDRAIQAIAATYGEGSPQIAQAYELKAAISVVRRDAGNASDVVVRAKNTWDGLFGRGHPSLRFAYRRLAKIASDAESAGLVLVWPKDGSFGPPAGPLSKNLLAVAEELTRKSQDPATERVITTKGAPTDTPYERLSVYYGTTRKLEDAEDPYGAYGHWRAPLQFGVVTVSVPDTHELGEIEAPSLLRFEFRPDPAKHLVLWDVKPLDRTSFRSALQRRVAASKRKEAFVFIHGYNTTFADAALRTAQMAFDLEVDGPAIMYSWPSRGWFLDYVADNNECNVAAFPMLADFLKEVATQARATTVNVLAHSMGNCFLSHTLAKLADAGERKLFNEVVFAAPDVDADVFRTLLPKLAAVSKRLTLYSSSNDFAMLASEVANGANRVGHARTKFSAAELDSIDASEARTPDDAGHSYFAGGALGDLRAVMWHALKPSQRCVLQKLTDGKFARWRLAPTACDDHAFRLAVLLLRRLGPTRARDYVVKSARDYPQDAPVYKRVEAELQRMTQ